MKPFDSVGVFTALCFSASVLLWMPIPKIPIRPVMDGMSWLFVHPLFLLEFILSLTVLVVWVIISVHFIHAARRSNSKLMTIVYENFHEVSLAASSLVVAFSGCTTFLRPINFWMPFESSWTLISRPIYFFGVLICIIAWVFFLLSKHYSRA